MGGVGGGGGGGGGKEGQGGGGGPPPFRIQRAMDRRWEMVDLSQCRSLQSRYGSCCDPMASAPINGGTSRVKPEDRELCCQNIDECGCRFAPKS